MARGRHLIRTPYNTAIMTQLARAIDDRLNELKYSHESETGFFDGYVAGLAFGMQDPQEWFIYESEDWEVTKLADAMDARGEDSENFRQGSCEGMEFGAELVTRIRTITKPEI